MYIQFRLYRKIIYKCEWMILRIPQPVGVCECVCVCVYVCCEHTCAPNIVQVRGIMES